jgi:nicotinamidase-related amidase
MITREECVVVVIDVQERLIPAIAQNETIVQNTIRIVQFARLLDIPIVITEQEKLGPTVAEVSAETIGVNPIGKVFFNCFYEDKFDHYMKQFKNKTLILVGVEAHICVTQTALHALSSCKVHVLADAIGSRTFENRDIAIERMRQSGVIISSTEMFIYEILQRAGTDKFKATLQLVK